ncbi:hypothetical protein DFH09DRAFT_1413252 [Mycena vulgaris]|nr:hypothetical protein DFH09DRAFT_1413252 [Mycena vulgaris]
MFRERSEGKLRENADQNKGRQELGCHEKFNEDAPPVGPNSFSMMGKVKPSNVEKVLSTRCSRPCRSLDAVGEFTGWIKYDKEKNEARDEGKPRLVRRLNGEAEHRLEETPRHIRERREQERLGHFKLEVEGRAHVESKLGIAKEKERTRSRAAWSGRRQNATNDSRIAQPGAHQTENRGNQWAQVVWENRNATDAELIHPTSHGLSLMPNSSGTERLAPLAPVLSQPLQGYSVHAFLRSRGRRTGLQRRGPRGPPSERAADALRIRSLGRIARPGRRDRSVLGICFSGDRVRVEIIMLEVLDVGVAWPTPTAACSRLDLGPWNSESVVRAMPISPNETADNRVPESRLRREVDMKLRDELQRTVEEGCVIGGEVGWRVDRGCNVSLETMMQIRP